MCFWQIRTVTIILSAFCFVFSAHAETPPIPKKKAQTLSKVKDRLAQETKKKSALQKKRESVNKDLKATKATLIDVAKDVQTTENNLQSVELRIANLEAKKQTLTTGLKNDKASIGKLILALERIRRSPPEALLAHPQPPYRTAQSAMLMADILPSINKHADALKTKLATLSIVSNELQEEQEYLHDKTNSLKTRQEELTTLIDKRNTLYKKINSDLKARELSIAKISLQAKDLEELVERIKEQERKDKQVRIKELAAIVPKTTSQTKHMGKSRLPISGGILTGYNEKDELGSKSKGITFSGRPNGLVVAPMNGSVQFTGAFKRYGNIVIIEHANGYHSLIAGLDKISSQVGDQIKSGEPIGTLPNSALISRPKLYYELRLNGKPINPSVKFAKLG